MLAGSTTAASTISTDTSTVHSPPSARSGRRRGLSYLRNYTYNHFGLDSARTTPSGQDETNPRLNRPTQRSRTAPAPGLSPSADAGPDPLRALDSFLGLSIGEPDTDSRMSRRTDTRTDLDGAGGSTINEFTSLPHLPLVGPSLRDTEGARQALLARAEMSSAQGGLGPSIQFTPATDVNRHNRPSLDFRRITRTLPCTNSIIRVGRYSERDNTHDNTPNGPSDAPIGFKSKVVSRKHCEFFFQSGQWYVKDVKSSSGTFLNHIRLSQPGQESKPFPIKDGDVVQLGIDFKGGEEMIFRCVKIRIETNRGWQKGLNKFNKTTHKQLQKLAKGKTEATENDAASKHSTECTICLNSIAPCQALFVAPCSHTWHYKCIRTVLENSKYPSFLCPNCRAHADLDAEIEENELEDFEVYDEDAFAGADFFSDGVSPSVQGDAPASAGIVAPILDDEEARHTASPEPDPSSLLLNADDLAWTLGSMSFRQSNPQIASLDDTISGFPPSQSHAISRTLRGDTQTTVGTSSLNPSASSFVPWPSSSEPVPITSTRSILPEAGVTSGVSPTRRAFSDTLDEVEASGMTRANGASPSPSLPGEVLHRDGPMTPRNVAGPFVLDGGGEPTPTHRRYQRSESDFTRDAL